MPGDATPILDIVRVLDEFSRVTRESGTKKSLTELAMIAADFLRLDRVPAKSTIRRWKKLESEYRQQAVAIKESSKFDRYRNSKNLKNLQ